MRPLAPPSSVQLSVPLPQGHGGGAYGGAKLISSSSASLFSPFIFIPTLSIIESIWETRHSFICGFEFYGSAARLAFCLCENDVAEILLLLFFFFKCKEKVENSDLCFSLNVSCQEQLDSHGPFPSTSLHTAPCRHNHDAPLRTSKAIRVDGSRRIDPRRSPLCCGSVHSAVARWPLLLKGGGILAGYPRFVSSSWRAGAV